MMYYVMLRCVMLWYAMLYYDMSQYAKICYAMLCYAIISYAMYKSSVKMLSCHITPNCYEFDDLWCINLFRPYHESHVMYERIYGLNMLWLEVCFAS